MKKVNEKECQFRFGDRGPKYLFRGPKIEWGVLLLKPNDTLGKHYHNEVEETFFLIEGKAIMIINDEKIEAVAGDAFQIQPKETHDILNNSSSDAKFVFIKAPFLPEDKVNC